MILFKSCPRCVTGDVVLDRDMYGRYSLCLHCGFMEDLSDAVETKRLTRRREVELAERPA